MKLMCCRIYDSAICALICSTTKCLIYAFNLFLAAPGAPPTNFIATPSTSRSSIITWDPPPFDEQNGIIIHYIINVTVVGTGQTFQLISNTTILSINTLTPFTSYICIIAAVTSAGIGPFSTQFNLVTPQDGKYQNCR